MTSLPEGTHAGGPSWNLNSGLSDSKVMDMDSELAQPQTPALPLPGCVSFDAHLTSLGPIQKMELLRVTWNTVVMRSNELSVKSARNSNWH